MKESDAWKADPTNERSVLTWNESSKQENPLWVTIAEGDQDNEEWQAGYRRETSPVTRAKCTAKRLIGRIPQYIKDATGNENLRWGSLVNPAFVDIKADQEYTFKTGYKVYNSREATTALAQKDGTFRVKWKNALTLAAQGAVALSLLAAIL